jgi:hypothetical protein
MRDGAWEVSRVNPAPERELYGLNFAARAFHPWIMNGSVRIAPRVELKCVFTRTTRAEPARKGETG